jgi:hypothetical protein
MRGGVEGRDLAFQATAILKMLLAKEKAQARKLAPNFISISSLADSEG